jgi:hypothetical protein
MHIEHADRQDITLMERVMSFQGLLDGKVFATQERLGEKMNLSKGQISKMLKAAGLLRRGASRGLESAHSESGSLQQGPPRAEAKQRRDTPAGGGHARRQSIR